jgi:beta,beta-carotene 9',10'-dioxygenase
MSAQYEVGFATLKDEIALDRLPVRGTLPEWLTGTLLRTGPAQFEVGDHHYRHWFDGLAMLHRFSFQGGAVSYANRFLHSKAYVENNREGQIAFREFATDPCRSIFKRLVTTFQGTISDNANVNISRLGDSFVALTEMPLPVMFEPKTLEALGVFGYEDNLAGQVTTAHPHFDRQLNAGVNYLTHLSEHSSYNVYAIPAGQRQRRLLSAVPADEPSYMHSFGLTERYVVLAEFPLVVNPLSLRLSGKPFIENFHWKPELGTRFIVIDKNAGTIVGRVETEAFFGFHHVNAFEKGDEVIVDVCAYPDNQIVNDLYLENLIGPNSRALSDGGLRRYHIPLAGGDSRYEVLVGESFDLPRINYAHSNGNDYRYAYGAARRSETPNDFLNQLIKVDVTTGETRRWHDEACYPGEAIFVAAPHATQEDDGVVLSIVLDGTKGTSFLAVIDAASFTELARAEVPHHIPFSFHGMYASAAVQ